MKNYIEPYIKEKSLLQLSLFYFGKGRPLTTCVEWKDGEGNYKLECICKYGVPGSFDQDVYTACMRIWVKQGMPDDGIRLNYSDIARELHLNPPRAFIKEIKKALKKLAQARYEFTECFILIGDNGPQKINTHFSLFDSASLFQYRKGQDKGQDSKRKSQSKLIFPKEIKNNLEAKYYQYLDMVWYRALPEGLPRRMYEYLDKRRYHNSEGLFTISEESMCRWLPITDKHTTQRRKTLKSVAQALIDTGYLSGYRFDTKNKLCIYRYGQTGPPQTETKSAIIIDQAPTAPATTATTSTKAPTQDEQLAFVEALEWLNSIPYLQRRKKREVAALPIGEVAAHYPDIRREYDQLAGEGKTPGAKWVHDQFTGRIEAPTATRTAPEPPEASQMTLFPADDLKDHDSHQAAGENVPGIDDLLALVKLDKITSKLRRVLAEYLAEKGYGYVRSNIEYSNKHAKRSYSSYLQICLEKDHAEETRERAQVVQVQRSREQEIRSLIEAKGGPGNVRYEGGRVQLCDAGLYALDAGYVVTWEAVEPEKIFALEDIPEKYRDR